ncbi:MAG TPA: S8 family serine peptidase, partial [Roseiflexaceae bacterium]|nr:S8 family serine peptidase [Roseiflexaceae bacterium]
MHQRILATLLLLMLLAPPEPAAAAPDRLLAGELVVRLIPSLQLTPTAQVIGSSGGALAAALRRAASAAALPIGGNTYRIRTTDQAAPAILAAQLNATPGVIFAEPNVMRRQLRIPNDELLAEQWALPAIAAFDAWEITTGAAIPIAVLDTGVSPTHLDLKEKLLPGYDFFNRDDDPRDDDGHGTFTAGLAAAAGDNGIGIAGVCWGCTIIPVKVLDRRGRGDDATIAAGIRWAADQGARVISMSLGGPEDTRVIREAVDYAVARGAVIVAASGNSRAEGNLPSYPAAYPNVLAVAAVGPADQPATFSTSGGFIDLAAPGVAIFSTLWSRTQGDLYGAANGTSAASPQVAGAAGLVLTQRPDLSPDQLADVIRMGADDIGATGRDDETGFGRLNIRRALDIAADPALLMRSRIEGVVRGAPAEMVTITLAGGLQVRPDANGFFRFDQLPPGNYAIEASGPAGAQVRATAYVNGTALGVAFLDLGFAPDARDFFTRGTAAGEGIYFEATGHTLRGAFQFFWETHGGLPIFGYPISSEFIERSDDGRDYLVQYFERHRFEYHPENPVPYQVQIARMGDLMLQQNGIDWFASGREAPQPGCAYIAETGHNLCEPFLSYWAGHGLELDGIAGKRYDESLALFGF